MKKKSLPLILMLISFFTHSIFADEGMWIPLLLEKNNIKDMQSKGLKLSAEDLYSINSNSIKDAIVIFGSGCTGELISDEGLLITNHHCGYSFIQSHSSVENDYLTDGFWAMTKSEELVNNGLTVTFLIRMEDVTDQVLESVADTMNEPARQKIILENIEQIVNNAIAETHYQAVIKPFFEGTRYYLYVNEIYKDVRLVGTPPSSIGKFGGDTDNWVWPRHTGDFSLFRIYAGKDNNPADYSPDNVPYKPRKFLPVSLKGVKQGDFTMVYGYPGTTQEYLPSDAVRMISTLENPHQINLREKKLTILQEDMETSAELRIMYSAKHARVANYWKKWIGENNGLKKLGAIARKEQEEKEFQQWVVQNKEREDKYGKILEGYHEIYTNIAPMLLVQDYLNEAVYANDLFQFIFRCYKKMAKYDSNISQEEMDKIVRELKGASSAFFKDYNESTDKKVFARLLSIYKDSLDVTYHPDFFATVDKKFKSDFSKFADFLYAKTIFNDKMKFDEMVASFSPSSITKLKKDPAWKIITNINQLFLDTYFYTRSYDEKLDHLNRLYITALMEMHPDSLFYPDANFTLRITYGQVKDYSPRDGVHYKYYTTLTGIMEKDNPDIYDYDVPDKLKELYRTKDYGEYAEDGDIRVCFTGTNHTTGGNSGSPVINGNGELIGVNFDRNWEGTMSDIMYDPDQCRNITLDIRYTLFIIDKFADAGHLLDEMQLIR